MVDRKIRSALASTLEHKQTYLSGQAAVDFSGSCTAITNNMIRGDSYDQSTGIVIKPERLVLRGNSRSSVGTWNALRLIIFQWNDAGTPVPSGILASVGVQNAPFSPFNWVNRSRFTVFHDQVVTMNANSSATVGAHDWHITISGMKPMHLASTGAGTIPVRNGMYFLVVSDDGVANYPGFDYVFELIYTDA